MKSACLLSFLVFLLSCSSPRGGTGLYLYRNPYGQSPCYYADVYGNARCPKHYQDGRQYVDGLAAVKQGGKWGFIDGEGAEAIPFEYDWVSSFGEYGFDRGVAIAKVGDVDDALIPMITPCRTFLIDTAGRVVSREYGLVHSVEYGLARVYDGREFHGMGSLLVSGDGLWGCVDRRGREVIPCRYEVMYPFLPEGFTFVRSNGLWGCIDRRGRELVPCLYDGVIYRSEAANVNTFAVEGREAVAVSNLQESVIHMFAGKDIIAFDRKGKRVK